MKSLRALEKQLLEIEEQRQVKRELPWDCKNLMHIFKDDMMRKHIIYNLFDKGREPPEPQRVTVEDQSGLSREAREFLLLTAEQQAKAVDRFLPDKPISPEEAEEIRRKILDKIDGIRAAKKEY